MTPAEAQAIRAAWAEWDAASAVTDTAWGRVKAARRYNNRHVAASAAMEARLDWELTLERTDKARAALADLPDLYEVEAWEREQAAIAADNAKQGSLF